MVLNAATNTLQSTSPFCGMNEIICRTALTDSPQVILHTKCVQIDGNYIGIFSADDFCVSEITKSKCIGYESYAESESSVYMNFRVSDENAKIRWFVAWECHEEIFTAPFCEKFSSPVAGFHNALIKENIQNCDAFLRGRHAMPLDEFLGEDVGPTGEMYAKFEKQEDGSVWIQICENIWNVLEAKIAMFHTQGYGILSVQTLEVVNGRLEKFKLEAPDIEQMGKLSKPMNSIWFQIGVALRTPEGIYYVLLRAFDLDVGTKSGPLYDIRNLYMNPIGERTIWNDSMKAVPYYDVNQQLSMKYVRPDYLYRSQFTNELMDVKIKHDQLIVKIKCRDCGGTYLGVQLEYRKDRQEDEETYLISYDSLNLENDVWIMTTSIDLKKYYLRMLYWDIRCAFEKDGVIYTVSCHSTNQKFLNRFQGIFVDRSYPDNNSILFPYATANDSVALMHRESCPQDHWRFRLKERAAILLYNAFRPYWEQKNIYLIFEKFCVMAEDNGYYFFKHCMEEKRECSFHGKIFYVLDSKSPDFEKMKEYKTHILKYLSLRHMIYLLACQLMISTETKGHAYVWRSMGSKIKKVTYRKDLVFLQHGVIGFKKVHCEKGTIVGCECFITSSELEQGIVCKNMWYEKKEVPVTGLARWDVLHDQSKTHREILLMPTWRTWLDDAENDAFVKSDYCINYLALLNNPQLEELLRLHEVTLNFYIHPKFSRYLSDFSAISDRIRLIQFGDEPLNELIMQCNLLVTDYSSVAWDVYYLKKPVLFYQFDFDEMDRTLGFYMDMKHDLFGERAETPDELINLIRIYIERAFQLKPQYLQNRERYFAYIDDHNSERIWNAIQERHWN